MADKQTKVGKITHYYDKLGVGIIKLSGQLSVGDSIKMAGKDGEFTQVVDSMQVEHEAIKKGKKGDEVGVKLTQRAKDNSEVFKV